MISRGVRGVIINISSNHAVGCWPDCSVYAAAKAGLSKFTKNCAMELAPYGIRGRHRTARLHRYRLGQTEPHLVRGAAHPAQAVCRPSEIADGIVFLASDKAAYITGATIDIDGGALLACVPENMFV